AKQAEGREMFQKATELKQLCDSYKVPLIINDRLDVAMAVGAAGVHVGQSDFPCAEARRLLGENYVIGVSAHNPEEALQAVADGADYLGCGAVFGSVTKHNVGTLGLDKLRTIRKVVTIPMVGIGGINSSNYEAVLETGANGAAVVSGILAAEDISKEVLKFKTIKLKFE
ncbi:MAG: thiamine phosphate synthase, partial [Phascolarctobacterium sp.]|nr:thiamine phosphate synthase [Phascolarctobacterium sp.]